MRSHVKEMMKFSTFSIENHYTKLLQYEEMFKGYEPEKVLET